MGNDSVMSLLDLAQGPLFRFAFALMVLGVLRNVTLAISDATAAYVTIEERPVFWRRLRQHVMWYFFPSIVLRQARPGGSNARFVYHLGLCVTSLVFRVTAITVPAFMVAHVYLWEKGIGLSWTTLPPSVADILSLVTIAAGLVLFLGRLYSPELRAVESPWSFLKPLILIAPFATGVLAMHPTWSPLDYHVALLLHVLSAVLVFVLVPFARMLACMHTPLSCFVPEAEWRYSQVEQAGTPTPAVEN